MAELANHSLGKMLDKAKNRGEPRPYLRNLNVRWFDFDLSDLLEMRFLPGEQERYSVRKGDLVICEGGYPGRAAIWDSEEPVFFQKALHRVRFHEPAHAKWCLYHLLYDDLAGRLSANFNGAGIQHFTGISLARYRIPVPATTEICRRVAILDEAFEGIATAKANAEKNLLNARDLFKSHLEHVFLLIGESSPTSSLEALTQADSTITYGVVKPGEEGEVAFVRGGDIAQGRVLMEQLRTISEPVSRQYRRTLLRGGELLISLVGQPGQVAVAPEDLEGANIARQVGLIRLSKQVDAEYVRYFLQSPVGQVALGAKQSGSVQQVINLGELRQVLVPIPVLGVQRNVVSALDAFSAGVERLTELMHSKRAALGELRKSLLGQAFAGAL